MSETGREFLWRSEGNLAPEIFAKAISIDLTTITSGRHDSSEEADESLQYVIEEAARWATKWFRAQDATPLRNLQTRIAEIFNRSALIPRIEDARSLSQAAAARVQSFVTNLESFEHALGNAIPPIGRRTPARMSEAEDRVNECLEIMRANAWDRGKTGKTLAVKWGVAESTVRNYSTEAWRRLRAEVTEPDRVVVKLATTLETVIDDAMAEVKDPPMIVAGDRVYKESPNAARKSVIEASKTLAALIGANAPQKHEHQFAGMSDEELRAKARELAAAVTAETKDE